MRNERRGASQRSRHVLRGALFGCALLLLLDLTASATSSVTLSGVTIRLQSHLYYRTGDYTRFVYTMDAPDKWHCDYWILGMCDSVRLVVQWTSPAFVWAVAPIPGMKFGVTKKKQTFTIDLSGQWGVAEMPVGGQIGSSGSGEFLTGWIDGPACDATSLSIAVTSGSTVVFPAITGPGLFPALNGTTLSVESTSPGWSLTPSESFVVPAGSSEVVVARIFEVTTGTYASVAGTTAISVDYALRVAEADFGSLPAGTYEITITYTVALN